MVAGYELGLLILIYLYTYLFCPKIAKCGMRGKYKVSGALLVFVNTGVTLPQLVLILLLLRFRLII